MSAFLVVFDWTCIAIGFLYVIVGALMEFFGLFEKEN